MSRSDLVGKTIEQICQKESDTGIESLTETEKIIFFITNFDSEVNINGLLGFYHNSSGDFALETVIALKIIGCERSAVLLEQANQRLSKNQPIKNRDQRVLQMKLLSKEAENTIQQLGISLLNYPDNLGQNLIKFIFKHKYF
jgi:hypothetical protein